MGDLKESALTQKNDCKWVRALDENGNSIRISKEDLAAVVGELLGNVTTEKSGLYPKDKVFLINWLMRKDMALYDEKGYYVELLTIQKEQNDFSFNSAIYQIQNTFYGAYHSAVVDLYFTISKAVKSIIISKAVQGGIFDLYSYDDGTLVHIYAKITGGNGPGRITIYQKLSDIGMNNKLINITLSQLTTIPEGASLIE